MISVKKWGFSRTCCNYGLIDPFFNPALAKLGHPRLYQCDLPLARHWPETIFKEDLLFFFDTKIGQWLLLKIKIDKFPKFSSCTCLELKYIGDSPVLALKSRQWEEESNCSMNIMLRNDKHTPMHYLIIHRGFQIPTVLKQLTRTSNLLKFTSHYYVTEECVREDICNT